MTIVYAPWNDEQIDALDKWQCDNSKHPYTCICGESLTPYKNGWCCDYCGHRQTWCFDFSIKENEE
jgi:hypothetical protein